MKLFLLTLNVFAILIGGGVFSYLLFSVDVTKSSTAIITVFILAISSVVWGVVTMLLYWFRTIILQKHSIQGLIRSQRQGFLVAVMTGVQLSLFGTSLWNVFSTGILGLVIVLLEYYFLSHESQMLT